MVSKKDSQQKKVEIFKESAEYEIPIKTPYGKFLPSIDIFYSKKANNVAFHSIDFILNDIAKKPLLDYTFKNETPVKHMPPFVGYESPVAQGFAYRDMSSDEDGLLFTPDQIGVIYNKLIDNCLEKILMQYSKPISKK